MKQAATDRVGSWQSQLFDEDVEPQWVEIDTRRIRVEGVRDFGGYWFELEVLDRLELGDFLDRLIPQGREDVHWSTMTITLVLMHLCEPSNELRVAEHLYERNPLGNLLGIPPDRVNEDRLYRVMDCLLPHKVEIEKYLNERLEELFSLKYDLLVYDVTSTYFEGDLRHFEREILGEYSQEVREGLEVRLCPSLDGRRRLAYAEALPVLSRRSRSMTGSRNESRRAWASWPRAVE